ncbi:DUF1574 domain-containing protein [Almyronema epifaneia]|uniref:DUF1574 domain-containing protein n=1 Tax=Almyronema epifaneia S1 TaxID=2991925 RepID=A0ABW6IIS2_9CYAN
MVSKQRLTPHLETDLTQLNAWLQKAIAQPQAKLQLKLRGNILHVLCVTPAALERETTLLRLVQALLEEAFKTLLSDSYPNIYQLYFYSRSSQQSEPAWSAPVYLNRLEKHLVQLTEPLRPDLAGALLGESSEDATQALSNAIVLSNLSLARKGDPEAIARYLSQTLSRLGIGVWVSIRAIPGQGQPLARAVTAHHDDPDHPAVAPGAIPRLWILCEAAYSPDPNLVAEPTAQQLRHLKLTQFQDAVILVQVQGEHQPDWVLRVDLTPREEMLRDWARWGDAEAIACLVEQTLAPLAIATRTELKSTSLHILCQSTEASSPAVPQQAVVVEALTALLSGLAPQGIFRALVYGQDVHQDAPDWIHCLDLPAQEHPALAASTAILAQQGDLPALAFTLTRKLNPHLENKLATGGIRVQLLVKDKLLHVMLEAPVCPPQRLATRHLAPYLRQLDLEGIEGIRLYGRRAGQKQPTWHYGKDFQSRDRVVPKAVPEFAASEAYLGDLLATSDQAIDFSEEDTESLWAALYDSWQQIGLTARNLLFQTQLFEPSHDVLATETPQLPATSSPKVALVWGTVGLLLVLQTDWLLGQILNPPRHPAAAEAMPPLPDLALSAEPEPLPTPPAEEALVDDEWAEIKFGRQADEPPPESLAADGFIDFGGGETFSEENLAAGSEADRLLVTPNTLLSQSPFPSFRSQQLDEKLALYYQRLQASGPPEVLVVGSSRALRGVDPAALERSLQALGYSDVNIFNFGVNGSTAQVVDFTIRQLLQPDQLPKLIVWADGARAFNSGRVDVTYNGITASEGYRQLQIGTLLPDTAEPDLATSEATDTAELAPPRVSVTSLRESYQTVDRWLSQQFAQLSAAHSDREQLKTQLQQLFAQWDPPLLAALSVAETDENPDNLDDPMALPDDTDLLDFDGFLALTVRFNPATYYQDHARVPGNYDSDYEDFRLQGRQVQALENLLAFTQQQNIPVVFVNTPLTDEYLDPHRMTAETEFQRFMLELSASQNGFVFRDLGQLWPERYSYFSDPSHLNRYGAYQVSNRLAQDPMIPWPRPQIEP